MTEPDDGFAEIEKLFWDEVYSWDWQAAARMSALEYDEFPWWDNFDRSANTLIAAMACAVKALEDTLDQPPEQRQALATYYRAQLGRVATELAVLQSDRRPPPPDSVL